MRQESTCPFNELLSIFVDDASGESDLAETDVFVHLLGVLCVKRTPAATHLEQKDSERPPIYHLRVPVFVQEHFGGQVFGRSTERVRQFVRAQVRFRKPKVAEGDVACSVKQDILGFQIPEEKCQGDAGGSKRRRKVSPVDNVVLVEVFEGQDQLGDVKPRPLLTESGLLLQVPEKFATALKVSHKV